MSRSKWKGAFLNKKYLKEIFNKTNNIIMPRNIEIFPKLVGLAVNVYNGKTMINIKITEDMIGYKLGSFASTRSKYKFKKKKSKK